MDNKQRLGTVLSDRMKKTSSAAVPTTVELGVINGNLSLSTDSLKSPIPKGAYMVDKRLTGTENKTEETEINGTKHDHKLPDSILQSGDRVLVAWCGNEPVVIAVVVGS